MNLQEGQTASSVCPEIGRELTSLTMANFRDLLQSVRQECELCNLFRPFIEHAQRREEACLLEDLVEDGDLARSDIFHSDPLRRILLNPIYVLPKSSPMRTRVIGIAGFQAETRKGMMPTSRNSTTH